MCLGAATVSGTCKHPLLRAVAQCLQHERSLAGQGGHTGRLKQAPATLQDGHVWCTPATPRLTNDVNQRHDSGVDTTQLAVTACAGGDRE